MKNIQTLLSPLIKNQFPAFYQDEGENFIQFVEAYFEWLESNHQLLEVYDSTGFSVGDIVSQDGTTGTIIDVEGNNLLVSLSGFGAFNSLSESDNFNYFSNESGITTYITNQTKLNPLYYSRRLLKLRDIDHTLDQFIVHFKEKYLKNIEFDIATNKQLLVKNSFDLYRSKGTSRSIDLFFRLIYGVQAEVYYPGDDLFRLSTAQWVKPVYIEITNSPRSIDLVGKQVNGVTSGATAFVEKYIKRRVKGAFAYVLYISNLQGEFIPGELLKSKEQYSDSPKVKGSLSGATVLSGGTLFEVGDIISFNSSRGDNAYARVSSISNVTGQVDFTLIDGGYGYTISGDPTLSAPELAKRTQSLVSEKVLTLSNVNATNVVSHITVSTGGSGYKNTDVVTIASNIHNSSAKLTTNSTGGVTYVTVLDPGSGFVTTPTAIITNSTGGATSGSGIALNIFTKTPRTYFKYFEQIVQKQFDVTYNAATNNQLFVPGSEIVIGNSTANVAYGIILENANNTLSNANGVLTISVSNNTSFAAGNTVYLLSNTSIKANTTIIANNSATATVMGIPDTVSFVLNSITGGTIELSDEVYFTDSSGAESANGTVQYVKTQTTNGVLTLVNVQGVFPKNCTIQIRNKTTTATVSNIQLTVGVYNISNNFTNTYSSSLYSSNTGVIANTISVSAGYGASFRVGTISEAETIYLNTDRLAGNGTFSNSSNAAYMSIPLNNLEFGFPKNITGNSSSIIFSCLNFDSFTIGSIASLNQINPGTDYTDSPYVLAEQPYLSGFDLHDYYFTITGATGDFTPGERILQANTTDYTYTIGVSHKTGIEIGAKVYQGSGANGIVLSVSTSANSIVVGNVSGTFQANTIKLNSYTNTSVTANVLTVNTTSVVSTAKGLIKSSNSTGMFIKRIQFNNQFMANSMITGQSSGATAYIVSVTSDANTLPVGINAVIDANVVTSNGAVSTLEIIDSGLGYRSGEDALFLSSDETRSGTARLDVKGTGIGTGYYKTTVGTLSSNSTLQDGDFYQEYSYEILTRIPLDRYAEMFRKVMHTAGTRFFGGVLIETTLPTPSTYVNSTIQVSQLGSGINSLDFSNANNSQYISLTI